MGAEPRQQRERAQLRRPEIGGAQQRQSGLSEHKYQAPHIDSATVMTAVAASHWPVGASSAPRSQSSGTGEGTNDTSSPATASHWTAYTGSESPSQSAVAAVVAGADTSTRASTHSRAHVRAKEIMDTRTMGLDPAHGGTGRAIKDRAATFCTWLRAAVGDEALSAGVLDVAGGTGELSLELTLAGEGGFRGWGTGV